MRTTAPRALLAIVLLAIAMRAMPLRAENVAKKSINVKLSGQLLRDSRQNPVDEWHFLRTSRSEGPIATRRWMRDGRYVSLGKYGDDLFGQGLIGFIFRKVPTDLAPFVAVATREWSLGLKFRSGDVTLAPGPDHAVVIGWRSPATGKISMKGEFTHGQKCCGVNSQINWYVERGVAPNPKDGFKATTLAKGTSDFGNSSTDGKFQIDNQTIKAGEFVYFVVDAKADGTGTPHHGDLTRFHVAIKMTDAVPEKPPRFEKDIRPILAAKCFDCHGKETQESRLDLRSLAALLRGGEQGPAIVRGHPERSYLVDLIERGEMPPEKGTRLTPSERSLLRRWIRAGAPANEKVGDIKSLSSITDEDRNYWAFQTPVKAKLPTVVASDRIRTPIDRFVLAALEAKGLSFSPEIDRVGLIRRAYFDLIGLPPTLREVDAFVADKRPDAYERLVDRLLASPQYGERWGRHWLDAAGYVDVRLFDGDASTIYFNDGMWRYRDYVFRSHNRDKPWDRFITEQLAGDGLVDWKRAERFTPETVELLTATSYLRNIEDHTSEPQYGVKQRYDVLFGLMEMVSTSLLGMTMECSRCHNHKFDPVLQRDYYRLMAYFESAYNVHNWKKPQDRWLPDVSPKEKAAIDQHNAALNTQISILQKQHKRVASAGQKDRAAEIQSQIQQLTKRKRSYGKIQALFDVGAPPTSRVLRRGDFKALGISIRPGGLEVVGRSLTSQSSNSGHSRLELAKWLTQKTHPLTPRVIVNRAWHHHFGVGIVATPGNFGRSGSGVTNRQLLDWLAADFVERGWSLKQLHRQIMISTVYRQVSRRPANLQAKGERLDPDNKLLWRMNLRRLESEIVRDAVLAASRSLDLSQGGAPVMLTTPSDGLSMIKRAKNTTDHQRRSVYLLARRVYPLKFLEIFDSPIMSINCTQRKNSATVLQSFAFLNSSFLAEQANQLGARLATSERAIERVYDLILSRRPDQQERIVCKKFLSDQVKIYTDEGRAPEAARSKAFADLCQMLLSTNEFLYVD